MHVRILRDVEELSGLEVAWNELIRDSEFQAPFHGWDWYEAWWKHFGAGGRLFVIAVEDAEGRLQVLAPFMKKRHYVRGMPIAEIGFFAHSITPHNTILFRRGFSAAESLALVFACLAEHRDEWDILNLKNIPAAAAYLPCLDEVGAGRGFQSMRFPGMQSALVAIDGSFDEYMSGDARKSRKRGILQKVRQLTQRPEYRVMEFTRPEEIERGLELAFTVSRSSWKGPIGNDMTGLAARRSFYEDITSRLARRGAVRIGVSFLGDTPATLHYQLLCGDCVYLIVNDFNDAFGKLSPGTVMLYQELQRLHEEKQVRQFVFSDDLYDYKTNWATGVFPHVNLEIFNDRLYSHCLWRGKKAMPLLRTVKASLWPGLNKAVPNKLP